MSGISGPSDQQASRAKAWEGKPLGLYLPPFLPPLPALGTEPAKAGGTGALLQLAPCPQVECNSKLDPTTTTFLKVRHPATTPAHQPCGPAVGRGCLAGQMGAGWCLDSTVCPGVGRGSSFPPVLFLSDGRFWWSSSGDTGKTPGPPAIVSPSLLGVGVMASSPLTLGSQSEHFVSILLQPGKLTEAFKYFLQGMGYSKYTSTHPGQGTGTQCPCAGESVVEYTLSPGPQRLGYSPQTLHIL